MRESPRTRRLRSDWKAIEQLRSESTILDFKATGTPPDSYMIRFFGQGIFLSESSSRIMVRDTHSVRVQLGAAYPRSMPELSWMSPIFHPNISGGGFVCLGGYGAHWSPSLNLDQLCEMLWDMIRYANYDVESPYNRDAATWARTQTDYQFPLDVRPIRDRIAAASSGRDVQSPFVTDSTTLPPGSKEALPVMFDDCEEIIEAEVVPRSSQPDDGDIVFLD